LFPGLLARLTRRRTPAISYIISGLLASALLMLNFSKGLVAAFTFAGLISTLTAMIPYAFCAAASLILQRRDPAVTAARRVREAAVAVIAFAICMWVIATSGLETVYWGFLLLMAGVPVFVALTPRTASRRIAAPPPAV
jgi:APA family basic amino acid/polyamine antiporter